MKKTIALLLVLVMLLALVSCGTKAGTEQTSSTAAGESGTAAGGSETSNSTVAETADTRTGFVMGDYVGNVDPASGAYSWVGIRVGVMETLFKFDENLLVQPNLASGYSVSEDGLTWTINLREDVTFQNGKVMNAEAVKASLERVAELQARAAGEMNIASIEAEGFTLKITTASANATLANFLCDPYAGIVDVTDLDADGNATIGTGPFMLTEYVENERMELDSYDNYWAGLPASNHVTIRSISDLDASSLALQKGELDGCYGLSYDARDLFDGTAGFKITQAATTRIYMMFFNLNHEYMNDANFRKAICMAVDREGYASVLVNGAGTATKTTFPASTDFGDPSTAANVPDYDIEGAKQLLADSGYVDTDGDGFVEKDGNKVSLQIITYGRTGLPQSAQALQSALKEIGIEASYEQLDSTDERAKSGAYDISVYAQVTMSTGDPYSYLLNDYKTGGTLNYGPIEDPAIDALVEEMAGEFDHDKRVELCSQVVSMVLSDNRVCNLFHLNMYMAMKDTVEGLTQSPVDYYHITYQTCVK